MASVGNLVANLTMNTSGFTAGVKSAQSSMAVLRGTVTTSTSGVLAALAPVGGVIAGAFAVTGVVSAFKSGMNQIADSVRGLAVESVSLAASMETNRIAFTTMLGSAQAAEEQLHSLRDFARTTPFEFPELVQQTRRLLAMGFEADQTIPVLRRVGDAVAALGLGSEGLDRITLALSQIRAKGKLSAQEVNQLAEAGIPAWEAVAKAIGISIPEAMKMAENGAISSGVALNAIFDAMGDRFAGGMQQQSKSLTGMFSNLKDTTTFILTDIGQAIIEAFGFKDALAFSTAFLDSFRSQWMPGIVAALNAVGAASQSTVSAMSDAWNNWARDSLASVTEVSAATKASLGGIGGLMSLTFNSEVRGVLQEMVRNFDIYFALAVESVKKSAHDMSAALVNGLTFGSRKVLGIDELVKPFDDTRMKALRLAIELRKLPKVAAAAQIAAPQEAELKRIEDAFAGAAGKGVEKAVSVKAKADGFNMDKPKAARDISAQNAAVQFGSSAAVSAAARLFNEARDPVVKATQKVEKAIMDLPNKLKPLLDGGGNMFAVANLA